jgi:hypothetical protein
MVPRFLNTGFKCVELTDVCDTQQLLDAAVALITLPSDPSSGWTAWTSLGGGEYLSSGVDAPQFKVLLTRDSAQRLSMRVRGMNDVTIGTRGLQIPSTNKSTARIFAGDGHLCIDVMTWSTSGEFVWCGSLDVSPDRTDFIGINTVWAGGSRRTTDWVRDNYDNWDYAFMQDGDDTPYGTTRGGQYRVAGGGSAGKRMLSGAFVYRPRELWAKVRGDTGTYGVQHWIGRCWQITIVGDGLFVAGSKFYVPIDTGVLAQFVSLVGPTPGQGMRAAMRCA